MESTLAAIFATRHCVHLPGWLSEGETEQAQRDLAGGEWTRDEHTSSNFLFDRLHHEGLHRRLNARVMTLAPTVSALLGGQPVDRFEGYIKRMQAGPTYRFPWHSDKSGGRLMGLSLSLLSAEGGAFELRKKWSKEPLAQITDLQPGDVHLFDVQDPSLVHRVAPVLSTGSRVFYAGWFFSAEFTT